MSTFDVTLPATQPVVFPRWCVVCEAENPDDVMKLSFLGAQTILKETDSPVVGAIDALSYGGNKLDKIDGVPVCKRCAPRLKLYHLWLKIGYYVMPVLGFIPIFFLHAPLIIGIPFLIACALSPGVFTLLVPPAFGATFFEGKANYEFRSKKVADEFAGLND